MADRFPPSPASASKEGHQSGRRKSLASPVSSVLARIHSTSILPQDRACQREELGARSALILHPAKQGQGKSKEAKLTLVCYAPQSLAEACNMVLPQAMHKTRHCASHLGHPRSIALIWFSQQADSTRGGAGYRRSHTSGQRRISTPLPRRNSACGAWSEALCCELSSAAAS